MSEHLEDAEIHQLVTQWSSKVRLLGFYPEVGTGGPLALAYTTLGLVGEVGEWHTKLLDYAQPSKALRSARDLAAQQELGDIFWYLDALSYEVQLGFKVMEPEGLAGVLQAGLISEPLTMVEHLGRIAEIVKKHLRDGTSKHWIQVLNHVRGLADMFIRLAEEQWGPEAIPKVLELNAEKLLSRATRGVLGGSGDNR